MLKHDVIEQASVHRSHGTTKPHLRGTFRWDISWDIPANAPCKCPMPIGAANPVTTRLTDKYV